MGASEKIVRVFVSSTYPDMHAERQILEEFVFPPLRKWCSLQGVELIKVDPRLGVTAEEAESTEALGRNLEAIDLCKPYFIGLLGERYGTVPTSLPEELLREYH